MSFLKKVWKKGDKLTVKELNRIEEGIDKSNNKLNIITFTLDKNNENQYTADANLSDTLNKLNSKIPVFFRINTEKQYNQPFEILWSDTGISLNYLIVGNGNILVFNLHWTDNNIIRTEIDQI